MISGLIPHRYAKALYKYALETKSTKEVYEEMKTVVECFRSDATLQKTLANPFVKPEDKHKLLMTTAGSKPDGTFGRFVTLVLDHKREDMFQLMAYAYRDIYRKENNISQVRTTTAVPMADAEMDKLRKVVQKSFPNTTFEYSHVVDPDIIGGFVIDVDSTRMDASMSGELEQLRQNLLTGK